MKRTTGAYGEARDILETSLAILEKIPREQHGVNDNTGENSVTLDLGGVLYELGAYEDARDRLTKGIEITVTEQTELCIKGADKQQVGEIAAQIRRIRPPEPLELLENKLLDMRFKLRGVMPAGNDVVIVTIDEKSIQSIGRWSWDRDVFAELLYTLTDAEPSVIAFDVIFS